MLTHMFVGDHCDFCTDGRPTASLQGDMDGNARLFLKIPFAKPPLGELRWKAPIKNDSWSGVRHEAEFAKPCAQLKSSGSPESDNEDCLYLNVWSPSPEPSRAPVMVWIHGGGNFAGSAFDHVPTSNPEKLWFNGRAFAEKHGVVVVTINYRLGRSDSSRIRRSPLRTARAEIKVCSINAPLCSGFTTTSTSSVATPAT